MAVIFLKWWRELLILLFFGLWLGQIAYTNHLVKTHKSELAKIETESIKALAEKQNQINKISSDLEAEKQKIKIEFREIKHETTKIVDRPIYRECKFDADGLRVANKAIVSSNSSESND